MDDTIYVDLAIGPVQLIAREYPDAALWNLLPPFRKEPGMSWGNPTSTVWITANVRGNMAGVCALTVAMGNARCKSDVVLAAYRGLGIYRAMSAFRLDLAVRMGAKVATAFAGPMSVGQFERDGFQRGPSSSCRLRAALATSNSVP